MLGSATSTNCIERALITRSSRGLRGIHHTMSVISPLLLFTADLLCGPFFQRATLFSFIGMFTFDAT